MATPIPAGLCDSAQRLWEDTDARYELATHELLILEQACRELTLIERIEEDIQALAGLTVKGSMGQPVISELVKEIRQHRAKFEGSFRSLNLPADEGEAERRSASARAAANARWRRTG